MAKHKRKSQHRNGSKKRRKTQETECSHDTIKGDEIGLEEQNDPDVKTCLFLQQYLEKVKARGQNVSLVRSHDMTGTIDDILLMGCDYLEPISEKHACCKALVTLLCGQLLDYGAEAPSPEVELAFKKMARACKEQMRE
ncbi:hypothetical protein M8818_006192 [Zalaria obscura]|uniref:Uncharacterized protein n=1 Tax=Zalaria obscura TaxID=2024903 RepID=A0ACC3S865_9PEZI